MKSHIATAIEERRLIRLEYDGRARTVEPHVVARTDRNEEALLCWQVTPAVPEGQNWRLFYLNKIYGLLVLQQSFEVPPEGRLPPMDMFMTKQQVA